MRRAAVTSSLSLTFAGHATVLLEMDGVRLLTDPLLRRRIGVLIRRSPVPPPAVHRDLSAVLISHAHLDHLDVPSLRLIDRRTPVVVPRGLGGLVRRLGFVPREMDVGDVLEVRAVGAGSELGAGGGQTMGEGTGGSQRVRVRAVPADHSGSRYPLAGEAAALGYVIEGELSAYFAGDTGLYEAMGDFPPVDVAVLPVGGWGPRLPDDHLNPLSAAKALQLLRPAACVPVHWGTIYPPWLPPEFNAKWAQWPHAFARYAAHLAPEVEVRVLQPGETAVFRRAEGAGEAPRE
jgi:L-ascorbate metabolism protein UlaG (beta-lactamase superfamily)